MNNNGESLSRDHYEALVIGSGFGGAVAACRLAQAGIDVAIAERGRRWRPGDFPRDLTSLKGSWIWQYGQGLYDARPLNDILAVCAAGYGGGSLVYANVAARPPDEVFDDAWPATYSRRALEPYFDLASYMLDVRPVGADPKTGALPPKSHFMAKAAGRLGAEDGFIYPNLAVTFDDHGPGQLNRFGVPQRGCTFCAECGVGCNVGAKNTLDHNYLALAERHGADVGVRTEALHIGKATGGGYVVRLREYGRAGAGRKGTERDVTARYVFVCAGALGTTELLLRSRDQYGTLPDLPEALGAGYSGNGDYLLFGAGMDEPFEPTSGPVITTATIVRADTEADEKWFVLEDGGYSRHLAKLIPALDASRLPAHLARWTAAGTLDALRAWPKKSRRIADRQDTAVLLAMGRDRAEGKIELHGRARRLRVTWDVPRNAALYAAERRFSGEVVRAFGGRPYDTPTWKAFKQPVTVHNLGGARMGDDPRTAVVDPEGEVFGHPGLYVLDGAALPGATGANPSLTITAVAERCIAAAVRTITGDPEWVAPEMTSVAARDVPEDRAVRALVRQRPRKPAGPGIRFRETMRGAVSGRRVVLRLQGWIPDLRDFEADALHPVRLTGTVEIDGEKAVVSDGTLNLLPARGGGLRTMDYTVPFIGDGGGTWVLRGSKRVHSAARVNPWRATTRLDVTLSPQTGGPAETGQVRISVAGVVGLPATVRATGTTGVIEPLQAVVRFIRFFTARLGGALVGSDRR